MASRTGLLPVWGNLAKPLSGCVRLMPGTRGLEQAFSHVQHASVPALRLGFGLASGLWALFLLLVLFLSFEDI